MTHVKTPEVAPGIDALLPENAVKVFQRTYSILLPGALAAAQDDFSFVLKFDPGVIGRHVGQKTLR